MGPGQWNPFLGEKESSQSEKRLTYLTSLTDELLVGKEGRGRISGRIGKGDLRGLRKKESVRGGGVGGNGEKRGVFLEVTGGGGFYQGKR